jgi:DNA-binding XRE family transcriptional regulator
MKTPLSINLKTERNKLKLTQQMAATKLRIPVKRYQSYEEDRAQPTLELLVKIANYFHVKDLKKFISSVN